MNLITTLEIYRLNEYNKNCYLNLFVEKGISEKYFKWLNFKIQGNYLYGNGNLKIGSKEYKINISYSPLYYNKTGRFDKIYIKDKRIVFKDDIHVYGDLSLCLYHPIIDKPALGHIPLFKIIPRITEWCIHFEEYLKYDIWLGKEIKY